MRIDDPQVLAAIERAENELDTLRRLAGFKPRIPTPDTTASRARLHMCPVIPCTVMCRTKEDLAAHVETMHNRSHP